MKYSLRSLMIVAILAGLWAASIITAALLTLIRVYDPVRDDRMSVSWPVWAWYGIQFAFCVGLVAWAATRLRHQIPN